MTPISQTAISSAWGEESRKHATVKGGEVFAGFRLSGVILSKGFSRFSTALLQIVRGFALLLTTSYYL